MKLPAPLLAIARPVQTWPGWLLAINAVVEPVAGAFGFQAVMLPVIDENMKRAAHGGRVQAPGTIKSVADALATVPVGKPPWTVMVLGEGLSTTGAPLTSPRMSWLVLVPLFATQNGLDD